jgi:hypothetical protein
MPRHKSSYLDSFGAQQPIKPWSSTRDTYACWLNQLSRVAEDEIIRWRWRVNERSSEPWESQLLPSADGRPSVNCWHGCPIQVLTSCWNYSRIALARQFLSEQRTFKETTRKQTQNAIHTLLCTATLFYWFHVVPVNSTSYIVLSKWFKIRRNNARLLNGKRVCLYPILCISCPPRSSL